MSDFSEKCVYYLHRCDMSVYRIAKYAGLDRTTLQRMVSGKRLPDVSVVKSFATYLSINMEEEKQLLALYMMEKIGKEKYIQRNSISELLMSVEKYRKALLETNEKVYNGGEIRKEEDVAILHFDLDICQAIKHVINKEITMKKEDNVTAIIQMDLFQKNQYIMKQLMKYKLSEHNGTACIHYINFPRNENETKRDVSQEYIKALELVVPFALSYGEMYKPKYSYVENEKYDNYYRMWPHFLLTSQSLLLFSEDGKSAMLIENKEMIEGYRQELKLFNQRYRKLVEFSQGNIKSSLEMLMPLQVNSKGFSIIFANFNRDSFIKQKKENEDGKINFLLIVKETIQNKLTQVHIFSEINNDECGNIAVCLKRSILFITILDDMPYHGLSIAEYNIVDMFVDYFSGWNEDSGEQKQKNNKERVIKKIEQLISQLEKEKGEENGN